MKPDSKILTLTFITLLLSSLLVLSITVTNVGAVPKPSVPQFSVKFIDNSYNVPPTQTIEPYTGKTTTQPSHTVKEGRTDVTITNLPSTPHKTSEGYECNLYYRVQYKGHYEKEWFPFSYMNYGIAGDYYAYFVKSSEDKYTVVSLSFNDFNTPPSGAQLDLRIQALYAYHDPSTINHMNLVHEALLVEATSGDWSKIQTITINYGAVTPMPSQTIITLPENSITTPPTDAPPPLTLLSLLTSTSFLLGVIVLFAGIIVVLVVLLFKKNLNLKVQHH